MMRSRPRRRALTAALALSLVASGFLAVTGLDQLRNVSPLAMPAAGPEKMGELLLQAWMLEELGDVTLMRPLERLPISLARGSLPVTLLPLYTNRDGVLRMKLPAGEYVLGVEEPRFQLLIKFEILGERTTEIRLFLRRIPQVAGFFELYDSDLSGWVDPWERVVAAVPQGGLNISVGQRVFLEVPIGWFRGRPGPANHSAASLVTSAIGRQDLLYLELKPIDPLRIAGFTTLVLVVYEPRYVVWVHGG